MKRLTRWGPSDRDMWPCFQKVNAFCGLDVSSRGAARPRRRRIGEGWDKKEHV